MSSTTCCLYSQSVARLLIWGPPLHSRTTISDTHLFLALSSVCYSAAVLPFPPDSARNRNKHTRLVHLKQRPFSCPYPSCEQRFGQKCDWKKHLLTHQRGTRRAASAGARIPPGRGFGTGGWGAGDSVGGLLGGPAGGAEAAGAGSGGGLISTLGGSGVDGTGGGGAGVGGAGVGGAGVGGASVGGAGGGGAGGDGVGGGGGGVSAAEELDTSGQGRQRDVANDGHAEDEVIDSEDRTLDQLPR